MKKMSKLVMAAILAVALQGTAMATVDLNDPTAGIIPTYAKELITVGTENFNDINDDGTQMLEVETELGFGVSNDQQRYLRFDLTGLKFGADITALDLVPADILAAPGATVALSQGGKTGDTYVIFHITADTDLPSNHLFTLTVDKLLVQDKSVSSTIRYRLYEFAADAVAPGNSPLNPNSAAQTYVAYDSGLDFSIAKKITTASVDKLYKEFKEVAGSGYIAGDLAAIGTVTFEADDDVLHPDTSDAVVIGDLIAAGSKFILTGSDFSAVDTTGDGVFLSDDPDCDTVDLEGLAVGTNQYNFTIDDQELIDNNLNTICFAAKSGTAAVEIAAQKFNGAIDLVAEANTNTADISPTEAGEFIHDGTVLRAPFMEKSAFISLANMSSSLTAPYTAMCYGPAGKVVGQTGNIAPGVTKKLYTNNLCTGTATTNAVELIMAVPEGTVTGSFVRQNLTTGDTGTDSMVGNTIR